MGRSPEARARKNRRQREQRAVLAALMARRGWRYSYALTAWVPR